MSHSFKKNIEKIKDSKSKENIKSKMIEVATTLENNPKHYKNLRKPLQEFKRVHVNKSHVIIFRINQKKKYVIFEEYAHHNEIYK